MPIAASHHQDEDLVSPVEASHHQLDAWMSTVEASYHQGEDIVASVAAVHHQHDGRGPACCIHPPSAPTLVTPGRTDHRRHEPE
ncbi:hypothetical protein [Tautonia plasticadhaerens]|uniref:hypothetical protein n=1 Tax=Tautonia plasticadhaerens TaxID=2527974 RepID=UPI00119EA62B|nr:hypothetical protein [Tautonia plasticadhaerens]